MRVPCLWVIWIAIIRSGCVQQPQIFMVLQPLTSQLRQVAIGPTHARGGTLDLMTDVPDLVLVAVVAPIGLRSLLSVGSHFHGSRGSKFVCYCNTRSPSVSLVSETSMFS